WFDAEMDRVSGWYKRHTQRLLLVIGVVIVLSVNIDTVAIARTLWTDPQVRAAVSAAAEADVQANSGAAAPSTAVVCSTKTNVTTATTTVLKGATTCAASLPIPLG